MISVCSSFVVILTMGFLLISFSILFEMCFLVRVLFADLDVL